MDRGKRISLFSRGQLGAQVCQSFIVARCKIEGQGHRVSLCKSVLLHPWPYLTAKDFLAEKPFLKIFVIFLYVLLDDLSVRNKEIGAFSVV